jgi:hypothetical protein
MGSMDWDCGGADYWRDSVDLLLLWLVDLL